MASALLAGKRHQPAIAQRDGAFAGAGVGLLADGDEVVALHDQTPVAGRIGGAKAGNRKRRARGKRRAQPRQRCRANERRVAIDDQDIVRPAFDGRLRGEHRMRGATAFALNECSGIRQDAPRFAGDVVLPGTDDDGGCGDAGLGDRIEDMGEQRLSGQRMQHFGPRRSHARALAGRQYDRQTGPLGRPGLHE